MADIEKFTIGAGALRRAPVEGGPLAEVVLGAENGLPFGVVQVTVPADGAMPAHDHGDSVVALVPLAGAANLIDVDNDERTVPIEPGTLTTIPVGRRVRLENPSAEEARLLVVVSPPDFAERISAWPPAAD